MELSWSTFLLEGINFLVLVWILQRLFYKPVLAVIASRRAGIEKTLADAKAMQEGAEALKSQYQSRLGEWEQERQEARKALYVEIDAERQQRLAELSDRLDQEREKARVTEERRLEKIQRQTEQTALAQAAGFAARLLSRVAGPELELRLFDLLLADLAGLTDERREAFAQAAQTHTLDKVAVASAYPLDASQRTRLEEALRTGFAIQPAFDYRQDSELLAGLRISLGPWVLHANLQDDLAAFAQFSHGSS